MATTTTFNLGQELGASLTQDEANALLAEGITDVGLARACIKLVDKRTKYWLDLRNLPQDFGLLVGLLRYNINYIDYLLAHWPEKAEDIKARALAVSGEAIRYFPELSYEAKIQAIEATGVGVTYLSSAEKQRYLTEFKQNNRRAA